MCWTRTRWGSLRLCWSRGPGNWSGRPRNPAPAASGEGRRSAGGMRARRSRARMGPCCQRPRERLLGPAPARAAASGGPPVRCTRQGIGLRAPTAGCRGLPFSTRSPARPAMADPQTAPKNCPGCGAKLPDVALSICPYCVTPLGLDAGKEESGESPFAGRIARLLGTRTWDPPWSGRRPRAGVRPGRPACSAGSWPSGRGPGRARRDPPGVGRRRRHRYAIIAGGVWLLLQGKRVIQQSVQAELLRRPGVIVDRRSETT